MQKIVCVRHNDGTSVMSGANSYLLTYLKLFVIRSHSIYVKMLNSGVQKLFREEAAPEITYIHCYNHRLNWYLWMLLSLSRLQTSYLDYWNPYYAVMTLAVLHELFLQNLIKLFLEKQPRSLKS